MHNKDIVSALNALIQLDIDAVYAYNQALENIDAAVIRATLLAFRNDHERHIVDLSEAVARFGEKPPKYSRDLKGIVMEGLTALRSATGTEGALRAMRANETTTNEAYQRALGLDLPVDAKLVVERNYADEIRHLTYIEQALDRRIWDMSRLEHAPAP